MQSFLSKHKGCDAMRRSEARYAHAYRHGAQIKERPTPSIVGALLSAACGKPANNLSHIKARQEVELLSGLLTPARLNHASSSILIVRLFCADFNKGVHHDRARTESISNSGQKQD